MSTFHSFICWGLLIAGSIGPLHAQKEFPLKDQRVKDADDPLVLVYPFGLWLSAESAVPDEVKTPPPRVDRRAAYFLLPIGGRNIVALYDGQDNPRLYVDTDGDGDLANEKPLPPNRDGRTGVSMSREDLFGPVTIRGTAEVPDFEVFVQVHQGQQALLFPARYKAGTIKLDGRSYNIALVDRNLDGRYDGRLTLTRNGDDTHNATDILAIDLDGDGVFNPPNIQCLETLLDVFIPDITQSPEIRSVTRFLYLGGVYYTLDIEPSGESVRLTRADSQIGTLDLGNDDIEMMLISENGRFRIEPGKSRWTLPAGRYSAYGVTLRRKDDNQIEWTLRSREDMGKLNDIHITGEKTTALKLGAPLQLSASVSRRRGWFRTYLELAPVIIGQGGESYGWHARQANRRVPAPRFRILDEQNNVLARGRFEYG